MAGKHLIKMEKKDGGQVYGFFIFIGAKLHHTLLFLRIGKAFPSCLMMEKLPQSGLHVCEYMGKEEEEVEQCLS